MFIKGNALLPDEVAVVKVLAQEKLDAKPTTLLAEETEGPSLEIQGFSNDGEILFQFTNPK
jgi:hypothetical protein